MDINTEHLTFEIIYIHTMDIYTEHLTFEIIYIHTMI